VAVACGLPRFYAYALFNAVYVYSGAEKGSNMDDDEEDGDLDDRPMEVVTWEMFERYINTTASIFYPDMDAFAFELLRHPDCSYLVPADFDILMKSERI
jgi:hypothetical protein